MKILTRLQGKLLQKVQSEHASLCFAPTWPVPELRLGAGFFQMKATFAEVMGFG